MAILRGFPPSNTINPTIRISKKDLVSFYDTSVAKHLTKEELERSPDWSLKVETKVVKSRKDNYWL